MDSIVQAFSNSNAMQILREDSRQTNSNSKFVGIQNMNHITERANANILPQSFKTEHMASQQFSTLGVENRVETGKVKDRLGRTYKVMESQLPPPNKDYRNTSAATSDRRLEKMGVFVKEEKKKQEVLGSVNPAETPEYIQRGNVLKNNMEMNNRDTFFNKNGLQPIPEFEQSRDMYDGYNLKSGHHSRTAPLEYSWREHHCQEAGVRKSSTLPESTTQTGIPSKRREISETFRVKNANASNALSIAARQTAITLPILKEASIRCDVMPESRMPKSTVDGQNTSVLATHNALAIEEGRLEEDLNVTKNIGNSVDMMGPSSHVDHLNELRQKGAVQPKPSREWNVIRKIAESIDHEKDDDKEIETILNESNTNAGAFKVYQATDGMNRIEMQEQLPTEVAIQQVEATNLKSDVTQNETREMNMVENSIDQTVTASAHKALINVNGTDSQYVHHTMSDAIDGGMHMDPKNTIQENDREQEGNSAQKDISSVFAPIKSDLILNDNDRQQSGKVGQTSVQQPEQYMNAEINISKERDQINRTQKGHMEQSVSNVTKVSLPTIERATLNARRPHMFKEANVQVQSKPEAPQKLENALYAYTNNGSMTENVDVMKPDIHEKERAEDAMYSRVNNMHATSYQPSMNAEHDKSLMNGGVNSIDRVTPVYKQDWRRNEKRVFSTQIKEERSVPNRSPSRTLMSQARVTPLLQYESKREMCETNNVTTSQSRTSTPFLIGRISRNEDC
jgi:hypothetical protein